MKHLEREMCSVWAKVGFSVTSIPLCPVLILFTLCNNLSKDHVEGSAPLFAAELRQVISPQLWNISHLFSSLPIHMESWGNKTLDSTDISERLSRWFFYWVMKGQFPSQKSLQVWKEPPSPFLWLYHSRNTEKLSSSALSAIHRTQTVWVFGKNRQKGGGGKVSPSYSEMTKILKKWNHNLTLWTETPAK